MSETHELSLKVLRLSRPSFYQSPAFPFSSGTPHLKPEQRILGSSDLSSFLSLPAAFGNIYLGETFSCLLNVNNESQVVIKDVGVKAELQTNTQRFPLADTVGTPGQSTLTRIDLKPGESNPLLISHEIKELHAHILVCSVHYTVGSERKHFRKFFKFQVLNPLAVKTKVNSGSDGKIFLEIQVQNITQSLMTLEKFVFQPADPFSVVSLAETETENVFEDGFLNPEDTRQYLYVLTPTGESTSMAKSTPALGKLDIGWRTAMGQTGRLQTGQLSRKVTVPEQLEVSVVSVPTNLRAEIPFTLSLRVSNTSLDKNLTISLTTVKSKMSTVLLSGISDRSLGTLEPGQSVETRLDFFPLYAGYHKIGGIILTDTLSGWSMEVDHLVDLFVSGHE
jgi:hypothetical protein